MLFMQRMLSHRKPGFSLVELVVVTPMIILLIGAVIGVTLYASTTALRANARAQLQNDVLSALGMIEQDILTSVSISTASPSQLVFDGLATDKNPLDNTRQLISNPPDCTVAASGIAASDTLVFLRTYRVEGDALVRETNFNRGVCSEAWQTDGTEQLIKNTSLELHLTYDALPGNPSRAGAVRATITGSRNIAGRSTNYTGTVYVTSINTSEPVPATPNPDPDPDPDPGPQPPTEIQDGSIIQEVTLQSCPSTRKWTYDARDNHTYWVQMMPDGKCWMLTNLAYAGGGTNTYGDVKTINHNNNVTSGSPSVSFTQPRSYASPTYSNPTTRPTQPRVSTNGGTTNPQRGYWYNLCAAMGGQTSTRACNNTWHGTNPNPAVSVCPSGWRLPRDEPFASYFESDYNVLVQSLNPSATDDTSLRTQWLFQRGGRVNEFGLSPQNG